MTRAQFHSIVWPFAIAETIVWAAFYYIFPALLTEWEQMPGWSKTELSVAFTLSLVVSALLIPVAGRFIDRGFAQAIFTGGTVLGAILLALLSTVTEIWQFYCIWIGLGVAMSSTLYEACFTVLVRSTGDRAKRAITIVAICAGFAGTVAFPGAHALVGMFGWRITVLVFAAIVAVVALPLIRSACRRAEAHAVVPTSDPGASVSQVLMVVKQATFWLIAIAFFFVALDHAMLISHVLPILGDRGVDAGTAVIVASFIGPMQVMGRLVLMAMERFVVPLTTAIGCCLIMTLAGICLLNAAATPALLIGFVMLQGAGAGLASVVRPLVTVDLLGKRNFGVVSGLLGLMHMSGFAVAPAVSAFVWAAGGYDRVIAVALMGSIIAAAALFAVWKIGARGVR